MMEMLVVMVVMGVLFAIAMRMLRSDRIAVQQAATIMTGQFARARLEAIKNNENVGIWVTGSNTVSSGSYKICVDANRNGACDSTETVLHSVTFGEGELAKVKVQTPGHPVIFNSRGISVMGATWTVLASKSDSSVIRTININAQGSASSQ